MDNLTKRVDDLTNSVKETGETIKSARKESREARVLACVALGINLLRIFADILRMSGIL